MLKTSVVLTFILSFGLLYLPNQVSALEIVVDDGNVTFYQDTVLGDSDGLSSLEQEQRAEITSRRKQLVRVKSAGERTEIELRPTPALQSTNPIPEIKQKLERIEQIEADRVSLEFESNEQDSVVVRSQNKNEVNQLEIESRQIKAKIRSGSEFELNSETNQVSLITPSGEKHTLNHLPDQAIELMQEKGLLSEATLDGGLVSVLVNDDKNAIEYRQKIKQTKKFLGLFNRQVETELILNDSTSELYEEPVSTGFQLFLDQLSF